jgi:hypothetical protein
LLKAGIDPDECQSFELTSYGPIFDECDDMEAHTPSRDAVAALEKALCDALGAAGYSVVNTVSCRRPLDETHWAEVKGVFGHRFTRLLSLT